MRATSDELETIPRDVLEQSHIVMENSGWHVGIPLTSHAMYWWGAFTKWCVAADSGMFLDYAERGALIVFRSRSTSFRWALHSVTGEFRNADNKRASWSGFLMRNPDIAAGLLSALAQINRPAPVPLKPLVQGLLFITELLRREAHGLPIVAMHLEEMEGAAMRALDYAP